MKKENTRTQTQTQTQTQASTPIMNMNIENNVYMYYINIHGIRYCESKKDQNKQMAKITKTRENWSYLYWIGLKILLFSIYIDECM